MPAEERSCAPSQRLAILFIVQLLPAGSAENEPTTRGKFFAMTLVRCESGARALDGSTQPSTILAALRRFHNSPFAPAPAAKILPHTIPIGPRLGRAGHLADGRNLDDFPRYSAIFESAAVFSCRRCAGARDRFFGTTESVSNDLVFSFSGRSTSASQRS